MSISVPSSSRRNFLIGGSAAPAAAAVGAAALARRADAAPAGKQPGSGGPTGGGPRATSTDLTKFADPLRIPPVLRPGNDGRLTVRQQSAGILLHSELPPTPLWTYEGSFPGPTIEVRRGQKVQVTWRNELSGGYPVTAVSIPLDPTGILSPGRGDATPLEDVAALPPWTVVHLHGAVTGADNDGWPENGVSPGGVQLSAYPNDQRATGLWYHDHAMNITAFTVYAGLAGALLIRDDEEDALDLPSGEYEIPLVLTDRNLDTDADGVPTGDLLHKVTWLDGDAGRTHFPFIGPYNLVNGVIWPYLATDAGWYRFRLLNGSNARHYTLQLHEENADGTTTPLTGALRVIGTDHGLLGAPLALDEVTLAPAERSDLLIDFTAHAGKRLRLVDVNTGAPSPLGPEVLQFRVGTGAGESFTLPATLSPTFERLTAADLPAGHGHRTIALTTTDSTPTGHPELWELSAVASDYTPHDGESLVVVTGTDGTPRRYRKGASLFDHATGFFVPLDSWERWNFINLAGPGHPMHLHLAAFQPLGRDLYTAAHAVDPATGVDTWTAVYDHAGSLLPEEEGWKDVIRVEPGELVSVAGQFTGASGRFVYHCHILEHEDEGMMRPFVVLPQPVLDRMPHDPDHH